MVIISERGTEYGVVEGNNLRVTDPKPAPVTLEDVIQAAKSLGRTEGVFDMADGTRAEVDEATEDLRQQQEALERIIRDAIHALDEAVEGARFSFGPEAAERQHLAAEALRATL